MSNDDPNDPNAPEDDFNPDDRIIDDESPDDEDDTTEKPLFSVKVAEARTRDVGRSIIRIDPETMETMNVKTGDIIEIIGKKKKATAAIAWPSYPQDQGLGIIRIDGRIRKNSNVGLNDDVSIRKAKKITSKNVILAPSNTKLRADSRFESFVKRKMLNLPVTKGDSIFISIGINREVSFTVVNTKPAGTVIIRPST
nr:hypothetical protein [Candidatus Sigynarchaeota archaeon]